MKFFDTKKEMFDAIANGDHMVGHESWFDKVRKGFYACGDNVEEGNVSGVVDKDDLLDKKYEGYIFYQEMNAKLYESHHWEGETGHRFYVDYKVLSLRDWKFLASDAKQLMNEGYTNGYRILSNGLKLEQALTHTTVVSLGKLRVYIPADVK